VSITTGTIDGDPMFSVPLAINEHDLAKFSKSDKQWDLCYEVHGQQQKVYNLVSDSCVTINAQLELASNPKVGNVITRLGFKSLDYDGWCHEIEVTLDGHKLLVDNKEVEDKWENKRVHAEKISNSITVSVPNCNRKGLSFKTIFHDMNGADMIKFVIAEGSGLSTTSHGLIGQFWNKQVEVRALTDKEAVLDTKYKVTINSPFSGRREFIGEYYPVTWDLQTTPCLYAGSDDGSPVIEGHLSDYEAGGLFNPDFVYSQFTGERCG
jgi:hypothetical protein